LQELLGSNCERVVQVAQGIIFTNQLTTRVLNITSSKVFGCAGVESVLTVNRQSQPNINAFLDGNKCCDVA